MGIMEDAKKLPIVLGFSRSIAENIFSCLKNAAILIIYTISHYAEISTLVFFQIQSQVDGVLHFRPVKVIQKISAVNSGGCWKILQYIPLTNHSNIKKSRICNHMRRKTKSQIKIWRKWKRSSQNFIMSKFYLL